jgi:hypothetical protein
MPLRLLRMPRVAIRCTIGVTPPSPFAVDPACRDAGSGAFC